MSEKELIFILIRDFPDVYNKIIEYYNSIE